MAGRKIPENFEGSVYVTDGEGDQHILQAGDTIPAGAKVGKHITDAGPDPVNDLDVTQSEAKLLAYVGDDADRAMQVFETEQSRTDKAPRKNLLKKVAEVAGIEYPPTVQ